jgi:hypothetical protein
MGRRREEIEMRSIVIAAAAVLATGCATGRAAHTGFHFHGDLGIAGSASETNTFGDHAEISGGGAGFSLAAGGAVVPNLILGGELWGVSVDEPEISDAEGAGTLQDVTYSVYGFGPRVTWYVMPANVYFSVTPSITQLSLDYDDVDETSETDWGLGLRAAVGKEWFVSDRWGLGVAGVLHVASNEDDADYKWRTWGGGVVFSASFN